MCGCEVRIACKDQEKHNKEKTEGHLRMTQAKLVEFEIKLSAVQTEAEEKIAGLTKITSSLNQKLVASEQALNTVQARMHAEFKDMQEKQQKKINKLETMLNKSIEQAKNNQWLFGLYTTSIAGDYVCPVVVKVSGFEDKLTHKRKWHSDPFCNDDKGYKMCLRVIIDGVGKGEGSHVSVFIYLMRGLYDAVLKWPMERSFEIELLNQKMDNKHYTNKGIKFTDKAPSANRVSSKQPDGIAPEGLGRNEFISHEDIKKETDDCQYLKNDCIFFRISDVTTKE